LKLKYAIKEYNKLGLDNSKKIVMAGGVAANKTINQAISELAEIYGFESYSPPLKLCTDNAAMIAWAGIEKFISQKNGDGLSFAPKARWGLSV